MRYIKEQGIRRKLMEEDFPHTLLQLPRILKNPLICLLMVGDQMKRGENKSNIARKNTVQRKSNTSHKQSNK